MRTAAVRPINSRLSRLDRVIPELGALFFRAPVSVRGASGREGCAGGSWRLADEIEREDDVRLASRLLVRGMHVFFRSIEQRRLEAFSK